MILLGTIALGLFVMGVNIYLVTKRRRRTPKHDLADKRVMERLGK